MLQTTENAEDRQRELVLPSAAGSGRVWLRRVCIIHGVLFILFLSEHRQTNRPAFGHLV